MLKIIVSLFCFQHIETAPKEILGEFPRIGRDGAIAFLKSGGVRNPALDGPDDHRSSPDEREYFI